MNVAPTIVPGTCTDCAPRIAQLEADLAAAYHDTTWGIGTRQAVEIGRAHV